MRGAKRIFFLRQTLFKINIFFLLLDLALVRFRVSLPPPPFHFQNDFTCLTSTAHARLKGKVRTIPVKSLALRKFKRLIDISYRKISH